MSKIGRLILDELGDTAIRWLESVGRKVTEQKFAPLLNNFDSFYPNLSAGKMGRYPNQVPMGR